MLYLTDYAGIGSFAAKLGTILLSAGRFVDAIDDPYRVLLWTIKNLVSTVNTSRL